MSEALVIEAPAKLNLSLRVLGKREDGFHEIESLMVTLPGLCDRLEVAEAEEDSFRCDAPGVPVDGSNLVVRARDRFREELGTGGGRPMSVWLQKRVPHGAGLGGGSSDAAAMLDAMNRLHGEPLKRERLVAIAAELGSDVPFFLGPPVAKVGGRGERLEVVEMELPEVEVLLLKPSFGVSTPDAYGRWKGSRELPGIDYQAQKFAWGELMNDLERPVFQKHLFLGEMKDWLRKQEGVSGALMSGSGSTMFALLEPGRAAAGLADAARRELDPGLWAWSGSMAERNAERSGGIG